LEATTLRRACQRVLGHITTTGRTGTTRTAIAKALETKNCRMRNDTARRARLSSRLARLPTRLAAFGLEPLALTRRQGPAGDAVVLAMLL